MGYQDYDFVVSYVDPEFPIIEGKVGIRVGTGSVAPSEVWFDNVLVTDLSYSPSPSPSPSPSSSPIPSSSSSPSSSPSPPPSPSPSLTPTPLYPSLNVLDIKQYSPPWKNQIYDTATSWSSNPTIERWGCALTSAVMILRYYGHTGINPDTLNRWLISQPDGFIGNGLINWLAITRYAKQKESQTASALEYRRYGNDVSILINELLNNRPAILNVPGHFVVAKGQTADSFLINDPGYSDRTLLSDYGNTFLSLNSFIPSHTDLSYLMLVTSNDTSVKFTDISGNPVASETYTENPLKDDIDETVSGPPLKITLLPKPSLNEYILSLENSGGSYNVDAYFYDVNGKVTLLSSSGNLSAGEEKDILFKLENNKWKLEGTFTINSILKKLHLLWKTGQIKNRFIYKSLKIQILSLKRFPNFKNTVIAAVKIATPRYITSEASHVLIEMLSNLKIK